MSNKPNITQDIWWQNLFNRTKRQLAARRGVRTQIKRKNNVSQPRVNRSTISVSNWIKLAIPLATVILVSSFLLNSWFKLNPVAFGAEEYKSPAIFGNRAYVLTYIYERINGFDYIDALALVLADYQQGTINATFINVDYYLRNTGTNYIQVRNILSNAQAARLDPLTQLTAYVETTLGLPVDRYLAVEKNNWIEMMGLFNIGTFKTIDEFSDVDAGTFKLDENLSHEQLAKYLAADSAGFNRKMSRAANIFKQITEDVGSWQWWQAAFNVGRLSELLSTDLSRSELYAFFNLAISTDKVQSMYLSVNESLLVSTKNGDLLIPSSVQTDDKIKQIYSRQTVVREQSRIELYNASRVNGLATSYKRQLSNHGANVIRAGNFADLLTETTLYVPNAANYPETVKLIKELTRDQVIITEESYPYNHTAEMVLVIGTNGI